ncbi:MAG: hypothetical protein ACTSWX_07265 [Promethearchaeota archaeon]
MVDGLFEGLFKKPEEVELPKEEVAKPEEIPEEVPTPEVAPEVRGAERIQIDISELIEKAKEIDKKLKELNNKISELIEISQSGDFDIGSKKISEVNTRIRLISKIKTKTIIIRALSSNSGTIYVGDSGVLDNGFPLEPGDAISLDIDLTKDELYISGDTVDDEVRYFIIK